MHDHSVVLRNLEHPKPQPDIAPERKERGRDKLADVYVERRKHDERLDNRKVKEEIEAHEHDKTRYLMTRLAPAFFISKHPFFIDYKK